MLDQPPYLKVKGEEGLVRDTGSNAILATSLEAKRQHLESQKRELNISKIGELSNRLDNVENSLSRIETLLSALINTPVINHHRNVQE